MFFLTFGFDATVISNKQTKALHGFLNFLTLQNWYATEMSINSGCTTLTNNILQFISIMQLHTCPVYMFDLAFEGNLFGSIMYDTKNNPCSFTEILA